MRAQYEMGPNTVYVDDDLVHSVNRGAVTLEMARQYLEVVAATLDRHGRAFLLTDASAGFPVSTEARKHIAEWPRMNEIGASAVFGNGIATRAMLTLITRAIALFGRRSQDVRFFATEAEARAFLDEKRAALATLRAS